MSNNKRIRMYQPNMFENHHSLLDMVGHKDMELGNTNDGEFERSRSPIDNLEGLSGEEQDPNQRPTKKKKTYHRHTQHQIQEMENFFKQCPHPDDKQRKELSRRLSLKPLQIKFWFQNKRTQNKAHQERSENQQLRSDNDKLRADNVRFKEALSTASCPTCGGAPAIGEMSFDEQQLRIENSRLREEIDRISGIAARYVGKPSTYSNFPQTGGGFGPQPGMHSPQGDLLRSIALPTEADKPVIVELAVSAMEELIRMAQAGDPLWVHDLHNPTEILNKEEYFRTFPRGIGPMPLGFFSEASRESVVVIMNPISLVEILMDVNQWSSVFSGIVARAMTLDILSTGVAGNYNGALQVMVAEFQVPSPLVSTRENYFVRYCKQHGEDTWAVVDVCLDGLRPSLVPRCRRRPSGCLIQEQPNGYSKVTWVEHVEVDDREVDNMYRALVNSGLAFGAKRWVSTLDRQCERLASVMTSNIPPVEAGVTITPEGRKGMMRLAERMVTGFCSGVGASTAHAWTTLSGSGLDDLRVMTRKSMDDPGRPPGVVLNAATSFWLPVPPKSVFDFFCDPNSRSEWDILSNGGIVQEMAHIANGRDPGNYVSLLRVNGANASQSNMIILQESRTDTTGSYVIYAPVDMVAMDAVLNGGEADYVALLPSGFAILPDGPGPAGGTLLTVAFQILVDSVPTAKLSLGSVATVNSLIKCTVERIRTAVVGQGA